MMNEEVTNAVLPVFEEQDKSTLETKEESKPTEYSEQDRADMDAAYTLLLNKLINVCGGNHPLVAVSALVSAAGCITVDTMKTEVDAIKQLHHTFAAVLYRVPEAFKARDVKEGFNG